MPPLGLKTDWEDPSDRALVNDYLAWQAPRLLMLQGLSPDERERMEIAARKHALEVDDYYPLYPEVFDQRLMSAIRVEARLRRSGPQHSKPVQKDSKPTVKPMSKDMRIFET